MMRFFENTFWLKRIAILISFVIVSLVLWNTYVFFQKFKKEERAKMELFATSLNEVLKNEDLNYNTNVHYKIYETITDIPLILTDEKGNIIDSQNLDSIKSKKTEYLAQQLVIMKEQNIPIEMNLTAVEKRFVYYRNSDLLYKLTYYPLALILILVLFLSVVYLFFNSNKVAEQNKLWTGMAKETAHQIGTPLSSLLGWIEILKLEHTNPEYIVEMQKDIDRLNTIANRFSKIGSIPTLEPQNIVSITKMAFDYLESRSSKQVTFTFLSEKEEMLSSINVELFGWVIENLVKNAIDAMQGKGKLDLNIEEKQKHIEITVSDTGKGMLKSQFKQIFKPGFTTKKRGWGLGLSLSKRIIEDYHGGKIAVQKSETGRGTTFQILLTKVR